MCAAEALAPGATAASTDGDGSPPSVASLTNCGARGVAGGAVLLALAAAVAALRPFSRAAIDALTAVATAAVGAALVVSGSEALGGYAASSVGGAANGVKAAFLMVAAAACLLWLVVFFWVCLTALRAGPSSTSASVFSRPSCIKDGAGGRNVQVVYSPRGVDSVESDKANERGAKSFSVVVEGVAASVINVAVVEEPAMNVESLGEGEDTIAFNVPLSALPSPSPAARRDDGGIESVLGVVADYD